MAGKSVVAFACLRYLSCEYKKIIVVLPNNTEQNQIVAFLVEDYVVWLVRSPDCDLDRNRLASRIINLLLKEIQIHCIYLDGYFSGIVNYGRDLKAFYQDRFCKEDKIEFLVATSSSMFGSQHIFGENSMELKPWKLQDYSKAIDAGLNLSPTRLKNLGLQPDVTQKEDKGHEEIKQAIKNKYKANVDHSCRFMLDNSISQIIDAKKMIEGGGDNR